MFNPLNTFTITDVKKETIFMTNVTVVYLEYGSLARIQELKNQQKQLTPIQKKRAE